MSKKVLILIAVALVFSACKLQADVIHSKWIGGEKGSWGDSNNWNPAIVPDNRWGDTFEVTMDSNSIGLDRVTVGLQQSRTINQLDSYGNVELLNWTQDWIELWLEDVNGLRNNGYLINEIQMLRIHENLDNSEGCTIEMRGSIEDEGDGNLENAGLILIPTMSRLLFSELHNVGQIIVFGGVCAINDVLDNGGTGTIQGFGGIGGALPFINNKGEIYATGGGLSVAINGPFFNRGIIGNAPLASLNVMQIGVPSDVNNFGTIEVNAGGGVAFNCNMVNEPNAVIKLLGGTLAAKTITQKAGATFEGFGGITSDLVINSNGHIKLTGPTNIVGNVNITEDATLEIRDVTTLITGHTICNGVIHIKGGLLIPQGGLSGECNIICEPAAYTNMTDFNLDGAVNFKDLALFADSWLWQTDLR